MNGHRILAAASAAVVYGSAAGVAHAQSDSVRCLDLGRIEHSEVVDDRTILFETRSGTVFRNTLDTACPGLEREQTFMYRVTLSRLCEIDAITVLQDMGFGFVPGASCTLGEFEQVETESAGALDADEISGE